MKQCYAYVGDEVIGAYVRRCLGGVGWQKVDDVSEAGVIISYCTHVSGLEDTYFDEDGLVQSAREGAYLIDLSPSTPSFARELAAVAIVNDLHPVEAPIAVNDPFAVGEGVYQHVVSFIAGEEDDVREVREVVESLAACVFETGPAGTAQLAKASNTVQMAAQVVGAVEAAAMQRTAVVSGVMLGGFAQPKPSLQGLAKRMGDAVEDEDYEGFLTVGMFMSDVAAAMAAADDSELILPQLEASLHLLELMAVIGGADKGLASLSLLYQEEEKSAVQGLDWTRAEGLYGSACGQGPDEDPDDFGFSGGFGEYLEN